ncbi:syncytin-B-like [Xyrichtys novacula]|uniref:Syncytin-B-like n=1 Tax=Xyrichtys novacula TaxID=13765 RepID=A0AAV1H9Q5_XYRNO|nr:syncytin-B-like [Xyrichtys novacula]
MAQQNRQVLNWLTADRGGVCHMFGKHCCTFIPTNTAPDGIFSVATGKLTELRVELRESAGKGGLSWDWLDQILGKWGAVWAKIGLSALAVLILISFLTCCIILRRQCLRALGRQVTVATGLQKAQMLDLLTPSQMAQLCLNDSRAGNGDYTDLYPNPACVGDSDEDELSQV